MRGGKKGRLKTGIRINYQRKYINYYGKIIPFDEVDLKRSRRDIFGAHMEMYYLAKLFNGKVEFEFLKRIYKINSYRKMVSLFATLKGDKLIEDFDIEIDRGLRKTYFYIKLPKGRIMIWVEGKKHVYWSILDKDKYDELILPPTYKRIFDAKYAKYRNDNSGSDILSKLMKKRAKPEEPQQTS